MSKSFLRTTAETLMRTVVILCAIFIIVVIFSTLYQAENIISDGSCNIAVYPIEGVILPYHGIGEFEMVVTPESVEAFLKQAEEDVGVEGVLVEINSPGGTPVASARIAERLHSSQLPVVGLAGDTAASGGYMIAAATRFLVASPMSDIGSIGVNMSYVEESKKNEEEGLTYVQLTTGKYKDIGDPNRPVTEEEKEKLLLDLRLVHDEFVNLVSSYRKMSTTTVSELADGSSMPGKRALEVGLVDALGGRQRAQEAFSEILSKPMSEIVFCEYKSPLLPF